jgi:hypothetical protein
MFRDQRGSERDQWCVPRSAAQREQGTERQSGVERKGHRYYRPLQTTASIDYRDRKYVNYRDHSHHASAWRPRLLRSAVDRSLPGSQRAASPRWRGSARPSMTGSCASRCRKPRRCWRSTRSQPPCSSPAPAACGSSPGASTRRAFPGPPIRRTRARAGKRFPACTTRRAGMPDLGTARDGDLRSDRRAGSRDPRPTRPVRRSSWRPWPASIRRISRQPESLSISVGIRGAGWSVCANDRRDEGPDRPPGRFVLPFVARRPVGIYTKVSPKAAG